MARVIVPAAHPQMAHLRFTGSLTLEDMIADELVGLNKGGPVYMLADITEIKTGLPDGFLEGARKSFFIHPNLQHMALITRSPLLKTVALMVAKATQRRDKISLHDTVSAGETYLLAMIRRQSR